MLPAAPALYKLHPLIWSRIILSTQNTLVNNSTRCQLFTSPEINLKRYKELLPSVVQSCNETLLVWCAAGFLLI